MTDQPSLATILIVDDNPTNLSVLFNALSQANYNAAVAQDGERSLAVAKKIQPDLIMLDILMPGIDGYETLRRLKADPRLQQIPVIIMTALSDAADEVKGLELGAVDFVTKPIRIDIVLARVSTHLTISNLRQELEAQNVELDAFAHTVAHELKGPLAVLAGFAELLHTCGLSETQRVQAAQVIWKTSIKMVSIVDELLLLSEVRKGDVILQQVVLMEDVMSQALQRIDRMREQYAGEIVLPESWPAVLGYAGWIEEVWVNYLSNGLKYGGQPPRLICGYDHQDDQIVRFWVKDNGPGISPEKQAELYAEFTRLEPIRASGHGLGLSIVKRIVDKLGGEVGLESVLDEGSTFYFTCLGVINPNMPSS